MKKRYIIYGFLLLFLTSCYYDSEEELYENVPCINGEVSYSNDIVPILSVNCYSCHSISDAPISGDGLVLEGYNNLVLYLEGNTETFLGSIEHNGNGKPMPDEGKKLDKCSIQAFKDWIEQGKLNN
jgi:hypothetical protein